MIQSRHSALQSGDCLLCNVHLEDGVAKAPQISPRSSGSGMPSSTAATSPRRPRSTSTQPSTTYADLTPHLPLPPTPSAGSARTPATNFVNIDLSPITFQGEAILADPREIARFFGIRPGEMRSLVGFETAADKMKPSKSDINWVIMDYLVSEGYPAAAEKFAQETNLCAPSDIAGIRERVRIRTAIFQGDISEAISLLNEVDAEILDNNPLLHFHLLQLQLIEIIRGILAQPNAPSANDFLPAIQFATEQLSPRAPTDPQYQHAQERTMALIIYPPEKMAPEFKELLDVKLREKVATEVNQVILESKGERREAKIRQLVRSRAWAETQARAVKVDLPSHITIGLDLEGETRGVAEKNGNGDAMVT